MTTTDSPDYAALLWGVLCNPDDDLPRLVLADWLEEHDQEERAEFIRLQCEVAQLSKCPRWDEFKSRETELWRQHYINWFGNSFAWGLAVFSPDEFRGAPLIGVPEVFVNRGFVTEVRCTLAVWQEHGPSLMRAQPIIKVTLTDREPIVLPYGAEWRQTEHPEHLAIAPESYILPGVLLNHLKGQINHTSSYPKVFCTHEAAHAALSDAAVWVGRREAGLPPYYATTRTPEPAISPAG